MATPGTKEDERKRSRRPQTERRPGQGGVVTRVNVRNGDPQSISTPPVTGASNPDTAPITISDAAQTPGAAAVPGVQAAPTPNQSGAGAGNRFPGILTKPLASTPPPKPLGQSQSVSNTAAIKADHNRMKRGEAVLENRIKDANMFTLLAHLEDAKANGQQQSTYPDLDTASGGGTALGRGPAGAAAGMILAATTATKEETPTQVEEEAEVIKEEADRAAVDPATVNLAPIDDREPLLGEVLPRRFGNEYLRNLSPEDRKKAIHVERKEARRRKMSVPELRRRKEKRHEQKSLETIDRQYEQREQSRKNLEQKEIAFKEGMAAVGLDATLKAAKLNAEHEVGLIENPAEKLAQEKALRRANFQVKQSQAQLAVLNARVGRNNKNRERLETTLTAARKQLADLQKAEVARNSATTKNLEYRIRSKDEKINTGERRVLQAEEKARIAGKIYSDAKALADRPDDEMTALLEKRNSAQKLLAHATKTLEGYRADAERLKAELDGVGEPDADKYKKRTDRIAAIVRNIARLDEKNRPLNEAIDELGQEIVNAYTAFTGEAFEPPPEPEPEPKPEPKPKTATTPLETALEGSDQAQKNIAAQQQAAARKASQYDPNFWDTPVGTDAATGAEATENSGAAATGEADKKPVKQELSDRISSMDNESLNRELEKLENDDALLKSQHGAKGGR
jgi:hypothetical protein